MPGLTRLQILTRLKQPIVGSVIFSLCVHGFVLFGIGFVLPDLRKNLDLLQPLEVVLVNSKSRSRPRKADALAQHNLDGGGNTADNKRASSPLPNLSDDKQFVQEQSTQKLQRLEQQVKKLITQAKSMHSVPQELAERQRKEGSNKEGRDLVERALEIARLEAKIQRDFSAYQKSPKQNKISPRTQEIHYAQYVEDWRIKVERIGNLNYPAQARQKKVFGKLELTVIVDADGTLEDVYVSKSSGKGLLDAAAINIVKMGSPYAQFSEEMRKQGIQTLKFSRTWSFTANDHLESE